MKEQLQPEQEEAQPERVVVVNTLRLNMGILFMEPVEDYPKGKVIACYGGYGSIRYIPGHMPKDLRTAAMDEDYCNEVVFGQSLHNCIQEIDLDEYPPGAMKLVVMDAEIIEAPSVEPVGEPQCKVIKHWASYNVPANNDHQKARKQPHNSNTTNKPGPNQIYFYPPAQNDVEPPKELIA